MINPIAGKNKTLIQARLMLMKFTIKNLALGPLLSSTITQTSIILLNILNNKSGKLPHSELGFCDVRDVALANM